MVGAPERYSSSIARLVPVLHGKVQLGWKVFRLARFQSNVGGVTRVKTTKHTDVNLPGGQFAIFLKLILNFYLKRMLAPD